MVKCVEELGAGFEFRLLGQVKASNQADVESLQTGAVDCIAANVSEGVGGRRGECGDAQRIQRALEVFRLSGSPLSALLAAGQNTPARYDYVALGLLPAQRSVLHERIAERFDAMLKAGLEDEVAMLRRNYRLTSALPSMRCVGYRQVWEVQDGVAPRSEMRDRGIYATRQLAKRQITWLSNTLKPQVFDCLAPDLLEQTRRVVSTFLD